MITILYALLKSSPRLFSDTLCGIAPVLAAPSPDSVGTGMGGGRHPRDAGLPSPLPSGMPIEDCKLSTAWAFKSGPGPSAWSGKRTPAPRRAVDEGEMRPAMTDGEESEGDVAASYMETGWRRPLAVSSL